MPYLSSLFLVCFVVGLRLTTAVTKDRSHAFGDILDIEACKDILSLQRSDGYKPLTLTFPTYKKWPYLDKIQKAVYLIDRSHLMNVRREFLIFLYNQNLEAENEHVKLSSGTVPPLELESDTIVAVNFHNDGIDHAKPLVVPLPEVAEMLISMYSGQGIRFKSLLHHWCEFSSGKSLSKLLEECDTNLNLELDWLEYLMCRNSYDQNGIPHDVSELDYMENIVLYDFQQRLNDPTDPMTLELLDRDEL